MMKQYHSRTILVFCINLSLLLTSCTHATQATHLVVSQPATAVATPTVRASSGPTVTPTQQPAPSPTPTQAAIRFLPTTFEKPGFWNLRHPYSDPNAPQLIIQSQDGYHLDPGFEVASIELAYRWIGIGTTVDRYQRIDWRDSGFWRGNKKIPADAVDKLVQAIAHLRQEPKVLTATVGSDDYPSWAIELTSVSGDKILLYSGSNSPSYIPWNVIFNGEIYSQYDEGIPAALDGLFEVYPGQTIVSKWERRREGYLPAGTLEPPPAQFTVGFSGLLPIYKDFRYKANAQKGELSGYLGGEIDTDRLSDIDINWLTDVQAMEIEKSPGQKVLCVLENLPAEDLDIINWKFSCPVGIPGDDISYRFPIRITYTTSTGQVYFLSGELFGYWESSVTLPVVPYPEEIGEILKSSPVAGDLLRDHLIYVGSYFSYASAATGIITHEWDADVVLLGQAQMGDRTVPYAITFDKVKIKDKKVVQWDIDRTKLESLLDEVLNQTVTRRFLEYDPQGVINLYYSEYGERPILEADYFPACAYIQPGHELPRQGEPLRGFSFNQPIGSWFYDIQIIFMDDHQRINSLDLKPASREDAYWMSVLPDALKPKNAPPFKRITVFAGNREVFVEWDPQASPADVSYYESMFTGWDVVRQTEYAQGLQLNQRLLDLTPDGGLVLVNCQQP